MDPMGNWMNQTNRFQLRLKTAAWKLPSLGVAPFLTNFSHPEKKPDGIKGHIWCIGGPHAVYKTLYINHGKFLAYQLVRRISEQSEMYRLRQRRCLSNSHHVSVSNTSPPVQSVKHRLVMKRGLLQLPGRPEGFNPSSWQKANCWWGPGGPVFQVSIGGRTGEWFTWIYEAFGKSIMWTHAIRAYTWPSWLFFNPVENYSPIN